MAAHVELPLRYFLANGVPQKDAARLLEALFALGFGHAMLTTNYKEMRGRGVPPVHFTEPSFAHSVRLLIDGYSGGKRGRRKPAPEPRTPRESASKKRASRH